MDKGSKKRHQLGLNNLQNILLSVIHRSAVITQNTLDSKYDITDVVDKKETDPSHDLANAQLSLLH